MWRDEKIGSYKESRDYTRLFEPRAEGEPELSKSREEFNRRREKMNEMLSRLKKKESRSDPGPSSSSRPREPEPRKELPYDKSFGSFFGPSQPIVAKRVLEEGRSRDEARRAALAKQSKPVVKQQVSSSSKTIVKTQKPVNKTKSKVQTLKEGRDYSFLFTEGGEGGGAPAASSQSKPAKSLTTPRATSSSSKPSNSFNSRPGTSSSSGTRPRPGEPSRRPAPAPSNGRPASSSSTLRNQPLKIASSVPRVSSSAPKPGAGNPRARPPELPARKPPVNRPAPTPSKSSALKPPVKKSEARGNPSEALRRPGNGSARAAPPPVKQKPLPQRPAPQKPMPQKRGRVLDDFIDDDDEDEARVLLPYEFRAKHNYYYDAEDSDVSDMETGFNELQAEEARSARIAREEDARELALIEEEERRERERLRKKRRKD